MLERFDVVVFDWDGTLLDSTGAIVAAIRGAAADLGLPDPGPQRAAHVIGLGLAQALSIAVPQLPPAHAAEFAQRYREHYVAAEADLKLFPHARELVRAVRTRGRRTAIATGKTRVGLNRVLHHLDMTGQFDASRCSDETQSKPSPRMLLELAQVLKTAPERMVMVGDTTHDLQMARSAGAAAVALTHGAHSAEALRAWPALGVFDSLQELHGWLMPG